jgi:hypothetical protein
MAQDLGQVTGTELARSAGAVAVGRQADLVTHDGEHTRAWETVRTDSAIVSQR